MVLNRALFRVIMLPLWLPMVRLWSAFVGMQWHTTLSEPERLPRLPCGSPIATSAKATDKTGGHSIGHHRGIGRAIELPYAALFNTSLWIVISFRLVYVVFNVDSLILYVRLAFVATLVQCVRFVSNICWVLSNIVCLCILFLGFV